MKPLKTLAILCFLALALVFAQRPPEPTEQQEPRLPDGRSQREEMLKQDHKKSLEDADELLKLAEQLKGDLERDDRHVLSISTLKKTEEIEKLAKRIRGRLKRY